MLVFLWLLPIVRETGSHNPDAAAKAQALKTYAPDLVVHSPTSYHLAPALVGRTGAIAVASLVLVPLAGLAARRRWSALVLGGTVLLLGIEPGLRRSRTSPTSSRSRSPAGPPASCRSRSRSPGAPPCSRALLRLLVLPVALAAGIVLQLEYPGDFGAASWTAARRSPPGSRSGAASRASPPHSHSAGASSDTTGCRGSRPSSSSSRSRVHGFASWDAPPRRDAYALTPGLVSYLRTHVPERAVVYGDLETSYRISAYVPVYVANAPPTHVADTTANDPYGAPRRAPPLPANGQPRDSAALRGRLGGPAAAPADRLGRPPRLP